MSSFWSWFCGTELEIERNVSYGIQRLRLNISVTSNDECVVNLLSTFPHILFIITTTLLLTCLSCTKYKNIKCVYLRKFACHSLRWVILVLFSALCVCAIAEGVLTDYSYNGYYTTQPHLYLPACFAFFATILSLVYYHHCETWQAPRLSWTLLIYWFLAFSGEIMRLFSLHANAPDDGTRLVDIFRYDISITAALIYVILIVLEIIVLYSKVSFIEFIPSVKPNMRYYEDYVNLLSRFLFYWINWLLKTGYDHPLEMNELGELPVVHSAKYNYQKFRRVFKTELEASKSTNKTLSLWKVYVKTYSRAALFSTSMKLIADTVLIIAPLSLDAIVSYAENFEAGEIDKVYPHYITVAEFVHNIYFLAVLFPLSVFIQYLFLQILFYNNATIGVHVRSAIQTLVYEKSLRIANLFGGNLSTGEITNHMSVDAMNLLYFTQKMELVWSVPIRIALVLGLLYYYVGLSAILGVLSVFIILPFQSIIVKKSSFHQKEAVGLADDRLKKSNEMLQGIKLFKLYGWEDIYLQFIEAARAKELKSILNYNIQFGNTVLMCFTLPVALNVVIFGTYPILSGENLTPSTAFVTFVLINLIVDPLYNLPVVLSNLVNAIVSTRRLQKFLVVPEIGQEVQDDVSNGSIDLSGDFRIIQPRKTSRLPWRRGWKGFSSGESQDEDIGEVTPLTLRSIGFDRKYLLGKTNVIPALEEDYVEEMAIKITRGHFTWDRESTIPILRNIHVAFPEGKLIIIVGAVGSGKSSFLAAILGEMTTLKGAVQFSRKNRKVAYAAQKPWVINATLRENILFGQPFHASRYQQVIDACALKLDLDILPAGDMTEIGEKGINLSGGQKQRVSVARAMYSDKDIVLMDDPLSALDVHVGDHLFTNGIRGMLLKAKRTVVLVTHQIQHLQHADLVLVMRDGSIIHQGTFDEIVERDPNLFADWSIARHSASDGSAHSATSASEYDDEEEMKIRKEQMRQKRILATKGKSSNDKTSPSGQLMEAEELERGAVSSQVYAYLFRSMGWPVVAVYLICRILQEIGNIGRQFWLAIWSQTGVNVTTNGAVESEDVNSNYYIALYTLISLGFLLATVLMAITAVICFYFASKRIHVTMIRNIFGSPMRFFDTTPAGRILNRLSSDTQIVDIKLLVTYFSFMYYLVSLPLTLLAIGVVIPIFLAEILPFLMIYYFIHKFFIRSSRELQRLDSVSRSPVFAHFSETLGGLTTIRAYGEDERFFQLLLEKIDRNNIAYLYLHAGYSWMGSQLNFISFFITLMASMTAVITLQISVLSSSLVGLSLSYGLTVTYLLSNILKFAAETEIQMNAVERVQHYTTLKNEDKSGLEPPLSWPHLGGIQIENISVRYAANLPAVLKGVNLYVRPGEKLGICGRTGSGKSSLTLSLFRVIDMFEGRILIDGVDISSLPLTTLRRRLSIIPQDPMLFSGTIRVNLDPEGTKSDEKLWTALETAQLKSLVSRFDNGLDHEVTEGGENLSVGQRQLFCLARAFLRNSQILVMDEATASIDYDTEKILQTVSSEAFKEKTVITIAHRVSTIMNSDTIAVFDDGRMVEHDTPEVLLSRKTSIFASLVQTNK